jgi:acyl-CoA thioester hydrolase
MSALGENPFRFLLRVRYGEVDAQKIVFNARWADYVDVAVTEFQRALWKDIAALEMRLAKQTIEWKAPAHFDDVIEARVRTKAVGTTSFTIATELARFSEGPLLAAAETVYVAFDLERGEKMPVPPRFRELLERGAPGVVVDHAGALR